MKSYITQITITPAQLTPPNAYILNSLDVFKNGDYTLREFKSEDGHTYIFIKCKIQLSKTKGKELKNKLKLLLEASSITFTEDQK